MKIGFKLDIQTNLNEDEMKYAKEMADNFIIRTLQSPTKSFGGIRSHGGRDTPYSRGTCMMLKHNLVIRRINRHKRIFGITKRDTLDELSEYGKLKFKNGISPPMFTYAQVGDIKG